MISSHLTPEPERRLWLIYDSVRHAVENAEWKLAALAALAALELGCLAATPAGRLDLAAAVTLGASLLVGVAGFSPLRRMPPRLAYLSSADERPAPDDCLLLVEDLAKHTHGELIARFDKYLGGGITALPYHEDITVQIAAQARVAALKRRLLVYACALSGLGQAAFAARLLLR